MTYYFAHFVGDFGILESILVLIRLQLMSDVKFYIITYCLHVSST
jgi:hypothetical protein